jgi:hypothetical protein
MSADIKQQTVLKVAQDVQVLLRSTAAAKARSLQTLSAVDRLYRTELWERKAYLRSPEDGVESNRALTHSRTHARTHSRSERSEG